MKPQTSKALDHIIVEGTRLRNIARASGYGSVADLLTTVIEAAQAIPNVNRNLPVASGKVVTLVRRKPH